MEKCHASQSTNFKTPFGIGKVLRKENGEENKKEKWKEGKQKIGLNLIN